MVRRIWFVLLVLALCFCAGCALPTVEQMYCLPRRPASYNDLQSVMDTAMAEMEYSTPKTGENQQTVQMADLDGDGIREYLLFAKNSSDKILRILIFAQDGEHYSLAHTLECEGASFDMVEYVQMDDADGVELVVGCQLNEQLQGVVSVYTFGGSEPVRLLAATYSGFLTCDLNSDGIRELMVLYHADGGTGNGAVDLYRIHGGIMERDAQQRLSFPVDSLSRFLVGDLSSGIPGVFISGECQDGCVTTNVYALENDVFTDVLPGGSRMEAVDGCSVYPVDIDGDGVVELPAPISVKPLEGNDGEQYLISWYAISLQGEKTDKLHTCCNFADNWYLELDMQWSSRICVLREDKAFRFYLWDETYDCAQEVFSILSLTDQNREQAAVENNRFTVYKDETVIYAARLEVASGILSIGQEDIQKNFHRIRQAWRTGEI